MKTATKAEDISIAGGTIIAYTWLYRSIDQAAAVSQTGCNSGAVRSVQENQRVTAGSSSRSAWNKSGHALLASEITEACRALISATKR